MGNPIYPGATDVGDELFVPAQWTLEEDDEWVGDQGGTTVGAVHGERGAERDASCRAHRAWTSLHRAMISVWSSAMMLGDLEGMGATGWVGAQGGAGGEGLPTLGRAH